MSMSELNATARDLMGVRAMIEELQAEAEALTDKLKAAMVEQGTEALQPVKIYIAGKITGDKKYRAKFREAAKAMEAMGHIVLNPAILPVGLEERDYMRITLAMDTCSLNRLISGTRVLDWMYADLSLLVMPSVVSN